MSRIEHDVKDYLKRILWSVGLGFLWLVLTLAIGMNFDLLVPQKTITIGNIIFYLWSVASLVAMLWINYRIWRKKFPHG